MNLEEKLADMKKWFDSKSPRDLLKMRYEHDLKSIPKFNPDLLREAIDNQLCLGDEECFYSKDPEKHKFAELWASFTSLVTQHLQFQNVEESVFPVEFFIVENNGKKSVISFMYGQGVAADIMPIPEFEAWMKRCDNKYAINTELFVTVDQLSEIMKNILLSIKEDIANASDKRKCNE